MTHSEDRIDHSEDLMNHSGDWMTHSEDRMHHSEDRMPPGAAAPMNPYLSANGLKGRMNHSEEWAGRSGD
ncbi:MAG: hypothetical protein LBQ14_06675 [Treponema sp.]|jgi:hypothetical protein|nr:hypothetical protein [Treponema sp.]